MQHLHDVTLWARPHDAKSKPVDTRAMDLDLLYDRISNCKVPRATKLVEQS